MVLVGIQEKEIFYLIKISTTWLYPLASVILIPFFLAFVIQNLLLFSLIVPGALQEKIVTYNCYVFKQYSGDPPNIPSKL